MTGYSDVIQVIGAMVIFSLVLLNVNKFMMSRDLQRTDTRMEYNAISHAQDIIERAQQLAFDAFTADGSIPKNIPGDFTSCGSGSGESVPADFNDFDDYDGYTTTVKDPSNGTDVLYTIDTKVCYVSDSDYTTCTGGAKTTHKRMTVTVSSPYIRNNITLSFIKSYY